MTDFLGYFLDLSVTMVWDFLNISLAFYIGKSGFFFSLSKDFLVVDFESFDRSISSSSDFFSSSSLDWFWSC